MFAEALKWTPVSCLRTTALCHNVQITARLMGGESKYKNCMKSVNELHVLFSFVHTK